MRLARTLGFVISLAPLMALADAPVTPPPGAAIYVLGEVHDNPDHHVEQTRLVAALKPGAIVWEMLTPQQLDQAAGADRSDPVALGAALGWADAGWPDFAMYHPIFAAAPDATHIGAAVDRDSLRAAMSDGALAAFGQTGPHFDAARALGPLDEADQAGREDEQAQAHCGALPQSMLSGMVEAQRLRDAAMAAAAAAAADAGLLPVVVITGSGHARTDTGIPAMLRNVRPDLDVWALGQLEADPGPDAPFDAVNLAPATPRGDPCAAFR